MQNVVTGPRLLTEAEIAEKIRRHEAEERARRARQAEEAEFRYLAECGIPSGPPFHAVSPQPWRGGLLYGPTGTGKTHLAICRLLSTPRPAFVTAGEYLDLARAIETERAHDFQEHRWDRIAEASHLVIDDVGLHRKTEFALEKLDRLMDDRWIRQAPILATSNLSPTELHQILPRFLSRLLSFGRPEKLGGPDRRMAPDDEATSRGGPSVD